MLEIVKVSFSYVRIKLPLSGPPHPPCSCMLTEEGTPLQEFAFLKIESDKISANINLAPIRGSTKEARSIHH